MWSDFGNLMTGMKLTEIPGKIAYQVIEMAETVELK
jgi:hypothetical protein